MIALFTLRLDRIIFFQVRVEEKAEVMFGTEWEARVIERFCRSMKTIATL